MAGEASAAPVQDARCVRSEKPGGNGEPSIRRLQGGEPRPEAVEARDARSTGSPERLRRKQPHGILTRTRQPHQHRAP